MKALPHNLTRTLFIQAHREVVFRFFTDSQRWARWWGTGSSIDARPGGEMKIRHPGGIEVTGEVLELSAPNHIIFTYGYVTGKPIRMGGSRVTIRLQAEHAGTRLTLLHEFEETAVRDDFVQGWRFQLSLFANVVADEANSNASAIVDRWFALWSIPDFREVERALVDLASPDIRFHDRFSSLQGIDDVVPHIIAAQRFMPNLTLQRVGDIRHCQGMVLAQWAATDKEGQKRMEGTNVFALGGDGRIEFVTGFHS
jgi:uncharacterized protein YndB with AHSA1/START domain